ncbi:DUF5675 family protein [Pantoea sp. B65]|uniref:DUF5675 family protein n=1 Tax=Pantoea sp. B65 TaxID=2813359 RepID=UPI0039B6A363
MLKVIFWKDLVYRLKWHASPKFARHSPTPQMFNAEVPSDRWILIHPGNSPQDTDGCWLPGKVKLGDRVNASGPLYNEIKAILNQKGIHNFKVVISSCYVNFRSINLGHHEKTINFISADDVVHAIPDGNGDSD